MIGLAARPKENSSSSKDSFDSDRAPMKHHRAFHRSSSPPLEVLKQSNVVEGADNELLDYGEQEDDHIDSDLYSNLPEVTSFSTQAVSFSFGVTERFTDLPAVKVAEPFLYLTPGASSGAQAGTELNRNLLEMGTMSVLTLVGASLEGKNGTQENFPADKEDLVLEVVGAIPSEGVIVDAEEEDVDDYARIAAKVILSKLFLRFKWTPLDQLHSLSSL
ncbi:hypothetical protein MRB53_002034 [Persea americana]|uniref:Uncharacterized protein n=1 Tax=Persea americana TaxID=3435 RepID=A0ACC2MU99_PERAE|nr:hypothetical protein MRB53_002034 [Persea americana]